MGETTLEGEAIRRRFFDCLPDALCAVDACGTLVAANAAFCALAGRRADALIGAPSAAILRQADVEAEAPPQQAFAAQDGYAALLSDGQARDVHWTALERDADGVVYLRLRDRGAERRRPAFAADDMSPPPEAGDPGERDAAIRAALEKAHAGNQAKARFLANVSHEIRTPMNGIMGIAELLRARAKDDETRRLATIVQESGETLLTVINDVLDFSKIEAGRLELESIPFEVSDVARRVESLHGLKASEKRLSLEIRVDPVMPHAWIGDPNRILQICHNLVGNALKFTETGGVSVAFNMTEAGDLRLTVRDSGIGMTAAEQARVFDEFSQADASTTRRYGGTGLGMSIVRGLVSGMRGSIALDSAPGEGTTVVATLGLRPSADGMAARDGHRHAVALPRNLRVLAVDDNAVNLMVLCEQLKKFGAAVVAADNGQSAVEAAADGAFDLYLLDISMPGLDGPQTLRRLRRDEAERGVAPTPAIAVTAHALTHQVEEYLASGFAAHVPKPFKPHELYTALAEVVAANRFRRKARLAS